MKQPDWTVVIRYMYENTPPFPSSDITEDHPFVTNTHLSVEQAQAVVEELEDWGLVSEVVKDHQIANSGSESGDTVEPIHGYKLTSDGFDVAHERELSTRNADINVSLTVFTLILVVITGIDVLPFSPIIKSFLIGMTLIALLYYLITGFIQMG
jgi:hypothetical protein